MRAVFAVVTYTNIFVKCLTLISYHKYVFQIILASSFMYFIFHIPANQPAGKETQFLEGSDGAKAVASCVGGSNDGLGISDNQRLLGCHRALHR